MAGTLPELFALLATLNVAGLIIAYAGREEGSFHTSAVCQGSLFAVFACLHTFDHIGKLPFLPKSLIAASIPLQVVGGIAGGLIYAEKKPIDWNDASTFLGLVVLTLGFLAISATDLQLMNEGDGSLSPAPKLHTQRLVVSGFYAYTRNPMITAAATIMIGLALTFSSFRVGQFAASFVSIKTMWFMYSEEPDMERRFGQSYRQYYSAVPRWIPRLTPYVEPGYEQKH